MNNPQPVLRPILDNIPGELRILPQWIAWRLVDDGGKKPRKLPIDPKNGRAAKASKPETWAGFETTRRYYEQHRDTLAGVGVEFATGGGLVGIDLDDSTDAEGNVLEWAKPIVAQLGGTYGERSPSGTGLKFLVRGTMPSDKGRKVSIEGGGAVEMYAWGRFFALTGHAATSANEVAHLQSVIDSVWADYLAPKLRQQRAASVPTPADVSTDAALKRCLAYLDRMPPAIEGQNGSGRTFNACCEIARFGLEGDAAWAAATHYNATRCEPAWSDRDLQHKIDDARDEVVASGEFGSRLREERPQPIRAGGGTVPADSIERPSGESGGTITNFQTVTDENGETHNVALSATEIWNATRAITGNWPRRVGGDLFVDRGDELLWLPKPADTFAYLHGRATVEWIGNGATFIPKAEFHAYLRQTVAGYTDVQKLPHFPPVDGVYYSHRDYQPGSGQKLETLLAYYSPATEIDRDLLLAAFVTPFWGGPPGCRPIFVFTGEGRGCGKSSLLKHIARLSGGAFDLTESEDFGRFKSRLLTSEAIGKRVVSWDNIKAARISSGPIEGLVTAEAISGHRLNCGERTRPNLLTWLLTVNGLALSRDLAQRSVIVKLARPAYSPTWEGEVNAFIDGNREELVSDIAAFFARPADRLAKASRWGLWEADVLARLAEPADAQAVIAERQRAFDADDEGVAIVEDYFASQLAQLGYDVEIDSVHIPNDIAAEWFRAARGERLSVHAMTREVSQWGQEELSSCLRINPSRARGRGLLWCKTSVPRGVCYDLAEQIQTRRAGNF